MNIPRFLVLIGVLVLFLLLPGCGSNPSATYPKLTGNWQIQTGASTPASSEILLLGALSNQGSAVSGTFRFTNLAETQTCGGFDVVVSLTGSVDSIGTITLTSASFAGGTVAKIKLTPSVSNSYTGTIELDGTACSAASTQAIAVQFPSLTGTWSGTLEPGTPLNPGTTGGGSAQLALTQATQPSADGQFPVNGTLTFTLSACTSTLNLTGTASGVELNLSTTPNGQTLATGLAGFQSSVTTQISSEIFYSASPCSASPGLPTNYSGNLLRQ